MKHLTPWLLAASLTACGETALLNVLDGSGPTPSCLLRSRPPSPP